MYLTGIHHTYVLHAIPCYARQEMKRKKKSASDTSEESREIVLAVNHQYI